MFCSELVALIYKRCGLFPTETNSSNWVTVHWSAIYGDDQANSTLAASAERVLRSATRRAYIG